jgi:hypothetical protein
MLGAQDALDVVVAVLRKRASQQALGGVRYLAETLVLARWLAQPDDPAQRRCRSYGITHGQLERLIKSLRREAGKDPGAKLVLADAETELADLKLLAAEDGIAHLRSAPDRPDLFGKHMPEPGYPLFSSLSELGSHPPGLGHLHFALQTEDRQVRIDLGAGHVHRAYWLALAYELFALIVVPVAVVVGPDTWREWMESEGLALKRATEDLRFEAKDRFHRVSDPSEDAGSTQQDRQLEDSPAGAPEHPESAPGAP